MKPSKRQKILLDFISDFIKTKGYSPSYREIQDALGYTSIATVSLHVHGLIERGYLRNKFNFGRSLEVVGDDEILLEKHIRERYEKASKTEKQIIIHALNILGFTNLTNTLK
jgi:SOS-response transcriptional repressor LexA